MTTGKGSPASLRGKLMVAESQINAILAEVVKAEQWTDMTIEFKAVTMRDIAADRDNLISVHVHIRGVV